MDNVLYTDCVCDDYFHSVKYSFDVLEKGFPLELYVEMVSQDYISFWERIIVAFKYIFKRKNMKETIISIIKNEDIPKMKDFFDKYIIEYNKYLKGMNNEKSI